MPPFAQIGRWSSFPAIVLAGVMLAIPALWNGFPILYYDSVDYIVMPFTGEVPPYRTASYTILTVLGWLGGSLWLPLAAQCLMAAHVLHETLDAFLPGRGRVLLLPLVAGLGLLTGLPWATSQLLADAFTGLLVLGMAALAFGGLPLWRQLVLGGVLVVAVAVHTSHIGLAAGLVLVFLGCRAATRWAPLAWLSVRPLLPAVVLGLGVGLATFANWAVTGKVFLSQPTGNLMLARLIQDGIGHLYLAEVCPHGARLRLCAVRHHLPRLANAFLWAPGAFYELGGWKSRALADEAAFVVADTLRRYPLHHARAALSLSVEQTLMLQTGDGVVNLDGIFLPERLGGNARGVGRLDVYFPADLPAYLSSRQRQGIDFSALNAVHVPVAMAGYGAVLALLLWGLWRRDRLMAGLAVTVVLALLGNAFICGALSNPNHRYQARIAWVALAAVVIGIEGRRTAKGP